ncbi:MAG: ribosome biogenesis GTPase Der [Candidatus Melainabacteria bacterium]|nr:ribosome biogenesis GTPase Der [Candidatus Melainabacteria bacterium]
MTTKTKNITVAIIGRQNVGKSTLFNRLIKERRSIVDDLPGVTRDRLYADLEWNGKNITLIDTGGLVEDSKLKSNEIISGVRKHVYLAINEADFIIFMVDGTSGITSEDERIARFFRKIKDKKKLFLAVNKIDTEKQLSYIYEFYSLGLGEPYPISALSGSSGLADILDVITSGRDAQMRRLYNIENEIKTSIVGKPNVGKSSILNCLVGKERAIVTPVPGTTRDVLDTKVTFNKKDYLLIDTAGLRRKSKVSSNIERYATTRTVEAIERSDIVLLVVDATERISDQDQKIASLIKRRNKASIILINKCDLIGENVKEETILHDLHFINYSKTLFTSATENKNIKKIWALIDEVNKNYQNRISTGKLNKVLEDIIHATSPPAKKGKQLKIYYATQANIRPPEIVLFVNDSELVNEQYLKFLEKEIRKNFEFSGSPLKFVFRNKKK